MPNDHDLLLRLDEKMDALKDCVLELKATLSSKADAERLAKLEAEFAALQNKVVAAGGGLAALEVALQLATRFLHF